jgi:hypothetical protein
LKAAERGTPVPHIDEKPDRRAALQDFLVVFRKILLPFSIL